MTHIYQKVRKKLWAKMLDLAHKDFKVRLQEQKLQECPKNAGNSDQLFMASSHRNSAALEKA